MKSAQDAVEATRPKPKVRRAACSIYSSFPRIFAAPFTVVCFVLAAAILSRPCACDYCITASQVHVVAQDDIEVTLPPSPPPTSMHKHTTPFSYNSHMPNPFTRRHMSKRVMSRRPPHPRLVQICMAHGDRAETAGEVTWVLADVKVPPLLHLPHHPHSPPSCWRHPFDSLRRCRKPRPRALCLWATF
jgi:hypothetical protein